MGGKSSSSAATSTSTTTTAIDRRVVADNGANVVGDGSTVTFTDLGAIQEASDIALASVLGSAALADKSVANSATIASSAFASTGKIAESAFGIASGSIAELAQAYKTANEQAQDTASGNRTLALTAVVALVAGIAYAASKN
jgi:uncharacterized tellurite resistance protein B-like protein